MLPLWILPRINPEHISLQNLSESQESFSREPPALLPLGLLRQHGTACFHRSLLPFKPIWRSEIASSKCFYTIKPAPATTSIARALNYLPTFPQNLPIHWLLQKSLLVEEKSGCFFFSPQVIKYTEFIPNHGTVFASQDYLPILQAGTRFGRADPTLLAITPTRSHRSWRSSVGFTLLSHSTGLKPQPQLPLGPVSCPTAANLLQLIHISYHRSEHRDTHYPLLLTSGRNPCFQVINVLTRREQLPPHAALPELPKALLCVGRPANREGCYEENRQMHRTFGSTKVETCIQQAPTSKPKLSGITGAPFTICFDGSCVPFHEAHPVFPWRLF